MISELQYRMSRLQDVPNVALSAALNWLEVREILQRLLNTNNSRQVLIARQKALAQKPGESVEEYGKRARQLMRQFEAYYGANYGPAIAEKMNEDISAAFAQNLRSSKLRDAIRGKASSANLDTLIHFTIELETSLKEEVTDPELTCSYCNTSGHRLKNCQRRDKDIDRSNALSGYNMDRHCTKCDAKGHSQQQCQVRAVAPGQRNSNNGNNNNYGNSSGRSSSNRNNNGSSRNSSNQSNSNRNNSDHRNNNGNNNRNGGSSSNGYDRNSSNNRSNGNGGRYDNRNRTGNNYRSGQSSSAPSNNATDSSAPQRTTTNQDSTSSGRQQSSIPQQSHPPAHLNRNTQSRGAYAAAVEESETSIEPDF